MTGLPAPRCPECGTRTSWRDLDRRARRVWFEVLRLRHANQDASAGLAFIGIAWVVRLVAALLSWPSFEVLVTVLALFTAVLSLLLGSQVFRILRLPPWAHEHISEPPNLPMGVATMLLSVGLMIVCAVL
jgi:hypothetical protein